MVAQPNQKPQCLYLPPINFEDAENYLTFALASLNLLPSDAMNLKNALRKYGDMLVKDALTFLKEEV